MQKTISDTKPTFTIDTENDKLVLFDLRELWQYRRLMLFLTWRDLNARYKQTFFGITWAVINPLMTMVVFTFVFSNIAKVSTGDTPYPIFNFSGLIIWQFFSRGLSTSAGSLVHESSILRKVYFPRMLVPISKMLFGLFDFLIAFVILLGMIVFSHVAVDGYEFVLRWNLLLLLPVFSLLALVLTFACSLWLSAMNVFYRDIQGVIPYVTQMLLFLSPVAYPSELVSGPMRVIYGLNPMVTVLDGYRWALLGTHSVDSVTVIASILSTTLLLLSGLYFFGRLQRYFVDYL
jgi:lipopolysaccharide transport system permease protein